MKVALVVLGVLLCARFLFPVAVVYMYANDVPSTWESDFSLKTLRQITSEIGMPTEDLSAKNAQIWIKDFWWGHVELRLSFEACCDQSSVPTASHLTAFVSTGFGMRKRVRMLGDRNEFSTL